MSPLPLRARSARTLTLALLVLSVPALAAAASFEGIVRTTEERFGRLAILVQARVPGFGNANVYLSVDETVDTWGEPAPASSFVRGARVLVEGAGELVEGMFIQGHARRLVLLGRSRARDQGPGAPDGAPRPFAPVRSLIRLGRGWVPGSGRGDHGSRRAAHSKLVGPRGTRPGRVGRAPGYESSVAGSARRSPGGACRSRW